MTNTLISQATETPPGSRKRIRRSDADTTPPRTPTALSVSAHQLLYEIQEIHSTLSSLENLAPDPTVNSLLTKLVHVSIAPYSSEFVLYFLSIPTVAKLCSQLRPLCSQAEGELEKFWAHKMIEDLSKDLCTSKDVLSSFPYYQNYVDLARLEYSIISAFLDTQPQNFAFVGSGPLPLTSLCLLDHCPNSIVLNIDRDTEAVRLSERLCRKLGFEDRVNFSCADITQQTDIDWKVFGVVFLAALVGEDTGSKMRILCDLRSKLSTGTLIIVRSAKGLREILYPVLELSNDFEAIGLKILAEVHPWTKVVNSVIVFKAI